MGGSRRAQRGLCKALGKPVDGWQSAGTTEACRCLLHDMGREVLAERGKLALGELVRLRVRYFTDGVVLGSKTFVEGVFQSQREDFSPKRKEGARRIQQS